MRDFIGRKTYVLADGSQLPNAIFNLHELRVGKHVVRDVTASVARVKGDPLLGQSFLAKLPAWTIDNLQHALFFSAEPGQVGGKQQAVGRVPVPPPQSELPNAMGTIRLLYLYGQLDNPIYKSALSALFRKKPS